MPGYARAALTLLRVAVALLLIIHGIARISLGIVDDFGVALGQWGFPLSHLIAWTITIVEIVGGGAMASGFFVRPLAVWFILELIAGIALVHARDGWFVVGAGRNGVEYSVLLIICLGVIALADQGAYRLGRTRQLI